MAFVWSEKTFGVSHLTEQRELPQLLKYVADKTQSQRRDRQNLLNDGEMLKLHGIKSFKKVAVEIIDGHFTVQQLQQQPGAHVLSVPVALSKNLQLLPFRDPAHVFATVGDLVHESPRPSAVIVNKTITLREKHCVIHERDILAITSVDKRCTNTGVVDFLICKHHDKTVGLPMACVGNFTALPDETHYTIKELVSKHCTFPQKVKFIENVHNNENSLYRTLARVGENQLENDREYLLQDLYKQAYLVCTKCDSERTVQTGDMNLYFIPANSKTTRTMQFRLPLFHDMSSYRQAVNDCYCPNLSMRYIEDCSPVEVIGAPSIIVRKLSEVYDLDGPQLPPRSKDQDQVSMQSFAGSFLPEHNAGSNYVNVKVVSDEISPRDRANSQQSNGYLNNTPNVYNKAMEEEEPLLTESDISSKANSPSQTRRRLNNSRGNTPRHTPVLGRKGASTPCTPESSRKKHNSPTSSWTEKISISLDNLKKNFRKAGSEEKSKLGDGSQLTDSFEELNIDEPEAAAASANYENVQAVITQLSKNNLVKKPPIKGQTRCAQIKELWTPPCSPDYRDHSTPSFEAFSNSVTPSYTQPKGLTVYTPNTVPELPLQKSATAPMLHQEPSFYQAVANGHPNSCAHLLQTSRQDSPVAAPRLSKEASQDCSNGVYENIDYLAGMTPQSRCSGYSSGSRGSSEGDLVQYQLESIRTIDMIPDDLASLSIRGLGDCLHLFELHNAANKFKQHQIDGQLFTMMKDAMFRDENFNFSDFEVLKLKRLRDGWRPKM